MYIGVGDRRKREREMNIEEKLVMYVDMIVSFGTKRIIQMYHGNMFV